MDLMTTNTHLMTAEDLIALPRGQHRYELVKGELLTMSPAGEEHGSITGRVTVLLGSYILQNKLGLIYCAETGFKLESDPDTVLAPDISFISRERVGALSESYRYGPPDLVVEVKSPGDSEYKIESKCKRWLSFGVKAVWLIDPKKRTVKILLQSGERTVLTELNEIVDDSVVTGFRLNVSEIFD